MEEQPARHGLDQGRSHIDFYLSDYISRFLTEVNPELIKWDNAKIEDKKLSDYENLEYKSGVLYTYPE